MPERDTFNSSSSSTRENITSASTTSATSTNTFNDNTNKSHLDLSSLGELRNQRSTVGVHPHDAVGELRPEQARQTLDAPKHEIHGEGRFIVVEFLRVCQGELSYP